MNKKRNEKQSMICLTPKPSQIFFVCPIQSKEIFFTENELFKEKGEGRIEQNTKRRLFFFAALVMTVQKDPTTSIRKHANKLKATRKLGGQQLNKFLNSDLNSLITLYRAFL